VPVNRDLNPGASAFPATIEIKAVSALTSPHEVQLVNYLKATGIKVGLLVNFGEQLKIIRRVF